MDKKVDKKGFYAIIGKTDKEAYLLECSNKVVHVYRSRLRLGYYNRGGKFRYFQEMVKRNGVGDVDIVRVDNDKRVFAENEVRAMGYRLLDEVPAVDVFRLEVPIMYKGSLERLVRKLDVGDLSLFEFDRFLDTVNNRL